MQHAGAVFRYLCLQVHDGKCNAGKCNAGTKAKTGECAHSYDALHAHEQPGGESRRVETRDCASVSFKISTFCRPLLFYSNEFLPRDHCRLLDPELKSGLEEQRCSCTDWICWIPPVEERLKEQYSTLSSHRIYYSKLASSQ
ncbi:hypothetical protein RvY_09950 [Ramazzottius varieornatus]|uniref:Uncharacterized protein n=1 Tax=Ramazzottius varieornatus TaxID=947166 RepID=A0A1D1VB50_RAMVA|nr:hypothetical protein RvY_09950 [Ramazzottius varieornatus]